MDLLTKPKLKPKRRILLRVVPLFPALCLVSCNQSQNSSISNSNLEKAKSNYSSSHEDPTPVLIGDTAYNIPRNCFEYPLARPLFISNKRHKVSGVLLEFLWPSMDCKSQDNSRQFSVLGFGSLLLVMIESRSRISTETVYQRRLVTNLNPNRFMGNNDVLPNPVGKDGTELLYKIDNDKDPRYSILHAVPRRHFLSFCSPPPEHRFSQAAAGGCRLEWVNEDYSIKFEMNPSLFPHRNDVYTFVERRIRSFIVENQN